MRKQAARQIVTRATLIKMLENPDKRGEVIGRALVALFRRQTEAERADNDTETRNFVGFSAADAKSGSITAKTYIKHKELLQFQIDEWMALEKGRPRIVKYWKQLNQIALEKELAKRRRGG